MTSLRLIFAVALAASLFFTAGCGSSETCTVTNNADGTATITCPDGTKVEVATPGSDDASCSITDNGDGTSTLTCDDGTTVTVSSDGDATCTIADNTDGSRTVACSDGTEALIPAPGCTTSRFETTTYAFLLHHCPGKDIAAFGVRRVSAVLSPQLTAGAYFTCGLRSDGRAHCWGSVLSTPPDAVFTHLAAGSHDACGLTPTGEALCWGENDFGQSDVPSAERFLQLAVGRSYACGLRFDGTVACWGNSGAPIHVPSGEAFVQIATRSGFNAARSGVCGLRADGSALCWEIEGNEQPVVGERFVYLSAGAYHHCGVRLDGSGMCWGVAPTPAMVPPGTYVQIDGGYNHACGLHADGSVTCWGDADSDVLTPPAGEVFIELAVDEYMACGLRANETAACWGPGLFGNATPTFPFACLAAQDPPSSTTPGVAYERWNNQTISVLPDFSTLGTPTSTGTLTNFSVPGTGDRFVVRETAWVQLSTSGSHWFELTSDDGSRLFLDGHEVVDHDGLHGDTSKIGGPYCIDAGWHQIVVEYFEATGGEVLDLQISTDGTTFAPIPDAALFH